MNKKANAAIIIFFIVIGGISIGLLYTIYLGFKGFDNDSTNATVLPTYNETPSCKLECNQTCQKEDSFLETTINGIKIRMLKKTTPIELLKDITKNGFKGVPVKVLDEAPAIVGNDTGAYYDNTAKTIFVVNQDNPALLHTLFHEYAHFAWKNIMSDSEKKEYCRIYTSSHTFVSKYAMTGGCQEDFAESYAHLMTENFPVPDDRKQFIKSIINKYAEMREL